MHGYYPIRLLHEPHGTEEAPKISPLLAILVHIGSEEQRLGTRPAAGGAGIDAAAEGVLRAGVVDEAFNGGISGRRWWSVA